MICRLLAAWLHVDWTGPYTVEARGGGPALDRALNRPRVIGGRATRSGDYFTGGQVPR